jgi:uncharacterized protein YutE (UPF0331/DUF86 family)
MKTEYERQTEREALTRLRQQFEPKGFSLIERPEPNQLPEFIGNYRPDALLIGPRSNILVEFKSFPSSEEKNIRAEFFAREVRKHDDWNFLLVLLRPETYGTASASEIRRVLGEFSKPTKEFNRKQEFVMAWAVFEAAARYVESRLDPEDVISDLPTFAVLEKLASIGEFDDDKVSELADLADVRNRLVHGGLDVEVPETAVDRLLADARQLVEAVE